MKNFALLLFFLLTLFQCAPPANQKKPPLAVKGALDLREWEFEKDGIVSLDGEWEFYWEEFVPPSEAPILNEKSYFQNFIKVPGEWNNFKVNENLVNSKGFGTYKLKVLLNQAQPLLSIKTERILSSYKLFVNGIELSKAGNISANENDGKPGYYVGNFPILDNKTEMEVLIQVSNFDDKSGGIIGTIRFGKNTHINELLIKTYFLDFFLFGSLLIMGIYHLGLYSLRKKDNSTLWFGLISLILSLRISLNTDAYLYKLLPNYWDMLHKLEFLTLYVGIPIFANFINSMFPEEFDKFIKKQIISVSLIFSLIVLLLPSYYYTHTLTFYQIFIILVLLYLIYVQILAVIHGRRGAKLFLTGLAFLSLTIINDILLYQTMLQTTTLVPFGFFIFIFSQAFVLSMRFARAFNQVEDLSENLERKVIERTNQLNQALQKSDKLLLNILPEDVAEELKEKGLVTPVLFESTSIMFTDFKGFTQIAEGLTPQELIKELDACFTQFDKITERYNLEKLKTIGDSYMCAGGIPKVNATHATDSCLAALEIQSLMNQMKALKSELNVPYWELRLGIHSGSVMAGVVGEKKFAYDIWGDTVNTASRMESSGTAGRINISYATYELVKDFFDCEYRGEVDAKNKGKVKMYYLNRIKNEFARDSEGLVPNEKFFALLKE